MQKICTEGKGDKMPMKKDIMSVKDVMVMETAASLNVAAILSGTGLQMLVLLQAANMTNVSSIPIPVNLKSPVILICYVNYNRVGYSKKSTKKKNEYIISSRSRKR